MNLTGNWNYPTAIRFGAGRLKELPQLCAELNMSHPLVVTDSGLAKLPLMQQLQHTLQAASVAHDVFADVRPNPGGADVERGVAAYRAGQHDGVIAIGGGSALDVGKAIALMAGQTRPLWDFEDVGDNWTRVNVAGVAPTIAIPTTSGTGSEVWRLADYRRSRPPQSDYFPPHHAAQNRAGRPRAHCRSAAAPHRRHRRRRLCA